MADATFDTLSASKALRDAGFEERQAEVLAVTMRSAVTDGVATKADIARLEAMIARQQVWLVGVVIAVNALFYALPRLVGT